jgi:glucokinase
LGNHLGKVFQAILYSYDPELIVVGGSLKNAWSYYSDRIWESLYSFAFSRTVHKLKIEISELENAGLLGAAALQME